MQTFAYNEKGPRRYNEDEYCLVFMEDGSCVAAVADGMGGHAGGDVAASIAIQTVQDEFAAGTSVSEIPRIAHETVLKIARKVRGLDGMGSTLTVVSIVDNMLHGAHVGDSHAYVVRNGEVMLVSEDHSVSGLLLAKGAITEEHSKCHFLKNQVVFACGMICDEFYTDTFDLVLEDGDKILLTTDGLHDNLLMSDIAGIMDDRGISFHAQCKKLIALSRFRGLKDNATLVAINYIAAANRSIEEYVFDGNVSICMNCGCDDSNPCQASPDISSDSFTCHWVNLCQERQIGLCSFCVAQGANWDDDANWDLIG